MKHPTDSFRLTSCSVSAALAMFTVSLSWAPMAAAQTAKPDGDGSSTWALGAGVAVVQKPYRDIDTDVVPLPLFSYENRWISASVPKLDLKLLSNESVTLSLRARYAGDGYDADDSPFLAGMDDRKGSIWAGGAMMWKTGIVDLSAEVLGDVSGNSKGSRAKLQAERRFSSGAFGITPRLGVAWVDSKFVDYYYGVRRSEARPNRGFYEGESATNVEAGVRMDYTLARRHTLFLDASATRFGSAIKDSPLVDSSSQTMVSVGYLYRF
ncbi:MULTISPECIES: MipA/OmpV family protein [Pectobacteriaceae]|uniref:MipA/OmpV family protein n=1 Tax=Affinibrenneria salicis TaxID=2590031 RepID=A0A5J5FSV7_9GAMM|nr:MULTISPECIES: MipA/OmpV family protein [Pectobacteriaceae]MEE3644423.1 MipA/OmpV family protein [Brenneria sp. L3_3C_1]MEE3651985.1 MipA/OmpV family protein [Brenneria sp. HEZEL_4_2_4]MEE3663669.1 MipA/OmpV family protein [Brenneria sp. g21c3]KAA8995872.1 MipA/OmpV family protein [Affinibrenneria salicis]MDX5628607.1 MipA/OmpV family protein [Brenneria sp. L3-3Z]